MIGLQGGTSRGQALHWFEQNAGELGQVVARLVKDAGEGVHVQLDLVPLQQLSDDCLGRHGVFVIVGMILIVNAGNLGAVPSKSNQHFLHVVRADCH